LARVAIGSVPDQKDDDDDALKRLTVNLSTDVYDRMYRAAAKRKITVTEYLRRVLAVGLYLDEHDVEEVRIKERDRDEFDRMVFPW